MQVMTARGTSPREANPDITVALKNLIKDFSSAGVTYEEICISVDGRSDWNANSLKQFVHRKGKARRTQKILSLAKAISKLSQQDSRLAQFKSDPRVTFIKRFLEEDTLSSLHTVQKTEFSDVWKSFHLKSKNYFLPETLAFVRFARNLDDNESETTPQKLEAKQKKIIITVLVTTRKTPEGYKFTMKILGRSKRVVIGEVYQTSTNTYFIGVAHPVNQVMSEDEFFELDAFSLNAIHQRASHNELGIESFCFSNSELPYSVIPVCFTGMDGMGRPFSGIGLLIDEFEFENYGIDDHVFSRAECSKQNENLTKLLEAAHA
ncbi:hypothetical protein AB9K41_18490, partial [Cribrihabitans sp. XS_ASV171]